MNDEQKREAVQRRNNLRRSALMIAEDKHGSDAKIIELKHALDDAMLAEQKFQDELRALRLDTQLARAKYEQALDKFVDSAYQLPDEDWEKIFARFSRG